MNREDFAKAISAKLEKVRKTNHTSITEMASALNIDRGSYVRNVNGRTIPNLYTLYKLANRFDISMDWLVLDKEPMYLKEKIPETKVEDNTPSLQALYFPGDIKELLGHMDKIPLLRYEILAQLHRFREEHQALVEKAMKANAGGIT